MTVELTIIAGRRALDHALQAAEQLGSTGSLAGLHAPLDGVTQGLVSEAWDFIKTAIVRVYEVGREKAQPALDSARTRVRQLLEDAGDRARALHDEIRRRLGEFMRDLIETGLAMLSPTLLIGEQKLPVKNVAVVQKVIIGGDIGLSLESAFNLASSGEFTLTATYES